MGICAAICHGKTSYNDKDVDGNVNLGLSRTDGGSNSIFGVDGSPVVSVFMRGYDGNRDCAYNDLRVVGVDIICTLWKRRGRIFNFGCHLSNYFRYSRPTHVFSVYNDAINNVVYTADSVGRIKERPYNQSTYNVGDP